MCCIGGCIMVPYETFYWSGNPHINYSDKKQNSIYSLVTLETNTKDIWLGFILWIKKQPGYKLNFLIKDTCKHYDSIDSIKFVIYTNDSKTIIDTIMFADSNNYFREDYFKTHFWAELTQVYLLNNLKNFKEDLKIDFTLYLKTRTNEQKIITYSSNKMKYDGYSGGVGFFPF